MRVYWSVLFTNALNKENNVQIPPLLNYHEPENILNRFAKKNLDLIGPDYRSCPAYIDQLRNTFALKFPFDYEIEIDRQRGTMKSSMYDQQFFDSVLMFRSKSANFFSLYLNYLFIAEEPLELQCTSAHMSDNQFVNNTYIMPGKFDIGKWVRPIECAVNLKSGVDKLTLNNGDDYLYVNFLTSKKVKLQRFYATDEIHKIVSNNLLSKNYTKQKNLPLQHWYDLYQNAKFKKVILKEIHNNLMT